MRIKIFNTILFVLRMLFFYIQFYDFYFLFGKIQIVHRLNFLFLFLMPKYFSFSISVYKKKFLFFYIIDIFLSAVIFLYFVDNSLNVVFPIAGVVYNKRIFEENFS